MGIELDAQQWALVGLLSVTFLLLITERLRIDITSLIGIAALPVLGILSPEEALSGFSSEPAIVVASVFVLSGALSSTGVSDRLGAWVLRISGDGFHRILAVLMLSVAALSAVTHHLTITAVMLPVTLRIAQEQEIAPSRLLMPMSFATSLGTTITILGAPAFLIADGLLEQVGRPGLGVFSIAPIGLMITIAGTGAMLLAGRFLLPERKGSDEENEELRLDGFYTEVLIRPDSALVGKTVDELDSLDDWKIRVVSLMRAGKVVGKPINMKRLRAGDVILIRTTPEELVSMKDAPGLALNPAVKYTQANGGPEISEEGTGLGYMDRFVQAVVDPGSEFIGRTIGQIDFFGRYSTIVVGIWRRRGWLRAELSRVKLRAGDVLMLLGNAEVFAALNKTNGFLLLIPFRQEGYRRYKGPLTILIMVGTIILAALEIFSIEVALMLGALATVLTGCQTVRQAYRSIDTRVFVFIAGAIPLGIAMVETGLSAELAAWLNLFVEGWPPAAVLALLFTISAVMTQLMSDAGTTVLLGPVAISLALTLGLPPEWFVVTVAVAAVASFLTPIGHHGNLLIYGPGGYEFNDFIRAGVPLTVLTAFLVLILAPVLWPAVP